jgi:GntR family transcriptional repressor for pyruvate dehydrogenase complex
MKLEPIKQRTISEDVINRILEMIRTRQIKPGERLPAERELSEMLQVSRPPLREALRTLAFMNVIDIRSGSGAYITDLHTATLLEHLDFIYTLDRAAVADLFMVRKINEPAIAEIAARRITDEQLAQLDDIVRSLRENEGNLPVLIDLDMKLHETIIDAADNPLLKRMMETVWHLSRLAREQTIQVDRIREQAKTDHEAIVAALHERNGSKAREAMRTHIENIEKAYFLNTSPEGDAS